MTDEPVAAANSGRAAVHPGSRLGPYVIQRQIGRGGMSVVYEAKHVPLDRVVALKILLAELSGDQEFVGRFMVEARAAARLDYPHIVPVYDCGEVGGINYIAMKLLEGRDLRAILDRRRHSGEQGLPLDRAISIASQAAGALEYAHRHHVVHRDVKPANIYVDENDRVTLVDFGIARALDYSSTTLTGTVMGTPAYMSPEQAQGRPADNRSDVYSLGIVLYEMLAGTPPFAGQPQAVMRAHVVADPPSLIERRATIPRGVEDIVLRALAKDPARRFQTAGALSLALTNAAGGALAQQALRAEDDDEQTLALPGNTRAAGVISGPHTAVPGGITHGTLSPAVVTARRGYRSWIASGATAVVLLGVLAWLFLAGPLAGAGELRVDTQPAGATVTVDGNNLGTTPLTAGNLRPGAHSVVVSEPSYVDVKRTAQIQPRKTEALSFSLAPLPVSDMLLPKQVIVATNVQASGGTISYGQAVTSVAVGQEFGLIVTLAQKQATVRDVSFQYQIALFGPGGNRLTDSGVATGTVKKDDTAGQSFAFTFTFNQGAAPGPYLLKFLVDGGDTALVTAPITLTQ